MRKPLQACVVGVAGLCWWPGAMAQSMEDAAGQVRTQATLEARHDWLDSGMEDWNAIRLGFSRTGTWTRGWYGALVRESRFGASDTGIELGGFVPLDDRWLLQLDGGAVSDAGFLPHGYAEARITRRLADGWLLSGAARTAHYPTAHVRRGSLDVERYVGTWRLAYGYDLTRLHGARLGSHEVSIDRYYGDRDVVGLRLGHGKEASQRPGGVLVAAGVSAAWVRGTHWFSPRWALDWSAGHVAQDVGYDRTWMQLGLRREF